jgi:hypothetical protein
MVVLVEMALPKAVRCVATYRTHKLKMVFKLWSDGVCMVWSYRECWEIWPFRS